MRVPARWTERASWFGAMLFAGFIAGWTFCDLPTGSEAGEAVAVRGVKRTTIVHGGDEAGRARELFERLNWGETAPSANIEAPPPPPPPPDVAVLLRQDLTAIEITAAGPVVWIVDPEQPFQRRAIAVGGAYRDGWKVAAITPQRIDLKRRRETRSVSTFAPLTQ